MEETQGARLRTALKRYKLTQAKAAELMGINPSTMRRYLADETASSFRTIHPCCEKLLNYIGRTHLYNSARDRSTK